jgi:hypothetical protein
METKALVIVEEKFLYRYEDNRQYDDYCYRKPYLHKFRLKKETEKSYFIYVFIGPVKRIPKSGKNIFAWDTEEKALFNYLKRKEVHASILQNKLTVTKRNLMFAENELQKIKQYKEDNPTTVILNKIKEER